MIENIMLRLYSNIDEYKIKINANDDAHKTRDIPFGTLYQHLLRKNSNEDFVSLLLHVDGVSVTKSTKLKMWMLSACFVELYPKLRNQRSNMVPISIWVGYTEPKMKLWLKAAMNQLEIIKSQGNYIFYYNKLIERNVLLIFMRIILFVISEFFFEQKLRIRWVTIC